MKNINIILFVVVSFIIGAFLGLLVCKQGADKNEDGSYADGWTDMRQRVISSGAVNYKDNQVVKSISGIVQVVKSNEIDIRLSIINPFQDKNLDTRTVKIDGDTKIYSIIKKDEEQYRREAEEAMKNITEITPDAPDGMPTKTIKKEVDVSQLIKGGNVTVRAMEDISKMKLFVASEIIIQ